MNTYIENMCIYSTLAKNNSELNVDECLALWACGMNPPVVIKRTGLCSIRASPDLIRSTRLYVGNGLNNNPYNAHTQEHIHIYVRTHDYGVFTYKAR